MDFLHIEYTQYLLWIISPQRLFSFVLSDRLTMLLLSAFEKSSLPAMWLTHDQNYLDLNRDVIILLYWSYHATNFYPTRILGNQLLVLFELVRLVYSGNQCSQPFWGLNGKIKSYLHMHKNGIVISSQADFPQYCGVARRLNKQLHLVRNGWPNIKTVIN